MASARHQFRDGVLAQRLRRGAQHAPCDVDPAEERRAGDGGAGSKGGGQELPERDERAREGCPGCRERDRVRARACDPDRKHELGDRKSTRLNSSHPSISYAVFCLKKKKKKTKQ